MVNRIIAIILTVFVFHADVFSKEKTYSERLNDLFEPVVSEMAKVIFWDPLDYVGLYDPVIYDKEKTPQIEKTLSGLVIATKGQTLIKGLNTEFLELEKGQRIILGIHVYQVASVVDDTLMNIDSASKEDLEKESISIPSTRPFPIVVLWLILGALFFTFKLKFINLRGVKHSIDLLRGKYDNPKRKTSKEELTRIQALSTALSGTVGLGNIASVAVAISVGGPGATLWMILAGVIGMASKFVEVSLGVKYREVDDKGVVHGGPMYYLKKGLAKKNLAILGKILAFTFALLLVGSSIGGGNMFQANQAYAQLKNSFPPLAGHEVAVGFFLAVAVGSVIIGGVKGIARVTEKIVPLMAGIYMLAGLIIILVDYQEIIPSIKLIFSEAFNASALKGGVIGVLIIGFQRAAFSNEAGIGSSAIAHAPAETNEHISEGFVALVEPFIDTVLICTVTAFVIIITGRYEGYELQGAELTSSAFGSAISWFPHLLTVAIFLFAFSTIISWSYYGLKAWTYIFGASKKSEITFKIIYLSSIILGTSSSIGVVLAFSDMMILSMAVPNIIGLVILSSEVKIDLKKYLSKIKSGEIKKYR